jgi:hypothetical protein
MQDLLGQNPVCSSLSLTSTAFLILSNIILYNTLPDIESIFDPFVVIAFL